MSPGSTRAAEPVGEIYEEICYKKPLYTTVGAKWFQNLQGRPLHSFKPPGPQQRKVYSWHLKLLFWQHFPRAALLFLIVRFPSNRTRFQIPANKCERNDNFFSKYHSTTPNEMTDSGSDPQQIKGWGEVYNRGETTHFTKSWINTQCEPPVWRRWHTQHHLCCISSSTRVESEFNWAFRANFYFTGNMQDRETSYHHQKANRQIWNEKYSVGQLTWFL